MIRWIMSGFIILVFVVGGYLPLSIMWRETRKLQSNTPFGGRFVKTADSTLYTQILGYDEQPTVVILPGAFAWSETWKPVMRFLVREGYRAVALDIPPFGFSVVPSKNYSRDAQAQRIKEAIDNLRIKKLILVIHGESAPAGFEVAQMLGERLKGLVIVSGTLGWPQQEGKPDKPLPDYVKKMLEHKMSRQILASYLTHSQIFPRYLKKMVSKSSNLTSSLETVYMTPFLYRGTNIKMSDWLKQHYVDKNDTLNIDVGFFKYFKVPILLIWGNRDQWSPAWHARKLKELMPQAEFALLSDVNHLPHIENEKKFNEELLKFISPIEPPRKLH